MGEKVAEAVVIFFSASEMLQEIKALFELGVSPSAEFHKLTGHAFEGKRFVLTGTLEHLKRAEAAKLIKERGGKVSASVSKKTDFLIAGEDPGSKLEKAKECAVTILDEISFQKLL